MTFDELRSAIEAQGCSASGIRDGCGSWATCEVHDCAIKKTLNTLATLEREHAERERRLREEVLQQLNDGFYGVGGNGGIYDGQFVSLAHRKLAEILDSSIGSNDGNK